MMAPEKMVDTNRNYPITATREDIKNHAAKKGDYVVFGFVNQGVIEGKLTPEGFKPFWNKEGYAIGRIASFNPKTGLPVIELVYAPCVGPSPKLNIGPEGIDLQRISNHPLERIREMGIPTISAEKNSEERNRLEGMVNNTTPSEYSGLGLCDGQLVKYTIYTRTKLLSHKKEITTIDIEFITGKDVGKRKVFN